MEGTGSCNQRQSKVSHHITKTFISFSLSCVVYGGYIESYMHTQPNICQPQFFPRNPNLIPDKWGLEEDDL